MWVWSPRVTWRSCSTPHRHPRATPTSEYASVNGFDTVWHDVLARFFARTPISGRWELNDFGATPGVVTLRLGQIAEAARADSEEQP
jgi:malonate decarboxylase acyl carrier protein